MANPITWQNVTPIQADPTRTMDSASRMFADMFSSLKSTLKEADDGNKLANTNAIREALYGAKTPEQLAALEGPNGQLAQLFAASGGNYDPAVQALRDGRASVLQQQGTAAIDYNNRLEDQTLNPLKEGLRQAYLTGDKAAIASFTQQLSGKRGGAEVFQFGRAVEDANTARVNAAANEARLVEKYTQDKKLWPFAEREAQAKLDQIAASIRASDASATASAINAETGRLNSDIARLRLNAETSAADAAKLKAELSKKLEGNLYKNGEATGADMPEFQDILSKNKSLNDFEKAKLLDRVKEYISTGVPAFPGSPGIPMPKDVVKGILTGIYDSQIISGWNRGGAESFEDRIIKEMQKVGADKSSTALKDYTNYIAIRDAIPATPAPGAKPPKR